MDWRREPDDAQAARTASTVLPPNTFARLPDGNGEGRGSTADKGFRDPAHRSGRVRGATRLGLRIDEHTDHVGAEVNGMSVPTETRERRLTRSDLLRAPFGSAPLFDQRGDFGIDLALAVPIAIPAAPGLHAEPARFAQMVGDIDIARFRIAGRGLALAPGPGDLQPRQVEHGERPHREAVGLHGARRSAAAARRPPAGTPPRAGRRRRCGCR